MDILQTLQSGVEESAARLFTEYRDRLYAAALSQCGNDHAAAEDLVMATFEVYLTKKEMFDPSKGTLLSWLMTVMHNLRCNDIHRSKRSGVVYLNPEELNLLREIREFDNSTDAEILAKSDEEEIARILETLPPKVREAMHLRFFESMPVIQIAKVLAVSPGAIRVRIHYGRKILQKRLAKAAKKPVALVLALLLGLGAVFAAVKTGGFGFFPQQGGNDMNAGKLAAVATAMTLGAVVPQNCPAEASGPRVTIVGDSYSTYAGAIPSGYLAYYTGSNCGITDVSMTWWSQVIAGLNGTLEVNNSWSGSFVSTYSIGNGSKPMIDASRLTDEALGDPDLILVCGGTNDSWSGAPIGDGIDCFDPDNWTAENLGKFRPAFAYLVNALKTKHPDAEIVVVANSTDDCGANESRPGIKSAIAAAMSETAAHYGAVFVQCQGISKTSEHPSAAGMTTMAEQVLAGYAAAHAVPKNGELSSAERARYAVISDPTARAVRTDEGVAFVFTASLQAYSFVAATNLHVRRALVVGGGGAGGTTIGGGGGGGEVKSIDLDRDVALGSAIQVTVGAGGAPDGSAGRSEAGGGWVRNGGNGSASSLQIGATTYSAGGGGGGASWKTMVGSDGANGGGSGGWFSGGQLKAGGKGADGGYDGGACANAGGADFCAGGGGGASAAGQDGNASMKCSGRGGEGVEDAITGESVVYGSGGGGGSGNNVLPGAGGTNAGSGNVKANGEYIGHPGLDGTGSGGGGGGYDGNLGYPGGAGGCGTVILLVDDLGAFDDEEDGEGSDEPEEEPTPEADPTVGEGCVRVEYVASVSGTPYVDTGYCHTPTTDVEIVAWVPGDVVNVTSDYGALFGSRLGSLGQRSYLLFVFFNRKTTPRYDRESSESAGSAFTYDKRMKVETSGKTCSWQDLQGGSTGSIGAGGGALSATGCGPMYLFAFNNNVAQAQAHCRARIYSAKIKERQSDGSYRVVHDYIPVKRIADGMAGFWDAVEQTLVSSADGALQAGPVKKTGLEISTPTYDGATYRCVLTRAWSYQSNLTVCYGSADGGDDSAGWEYTTAFGTFAEEKTTMISTFDIPEGTKFFRFRSDEDGWSETVSVDELDAGGDVSGGPLVDDSACLGTTQTGAEFSVNLSYLGLHAERCDVSIVYSDGGFTYTNCVLTGVDAAKMLKFSIGGLKPATDYTYRIVVDNGLEDGVTETPVAAFATTADAKCGLTVSNFCFDGLGIRADLVRGSAKDVAVTVYYGDTYGGESTSAWAHRADAGAFVAPNATATAYLARFEGDTPRYVRFRDADGNWTPTLYLQEETPTARQPLEIRDFVKTDASKTTVSFAVTLASPGPNATADVAIVYSHDGFTYTNSVATSLADPVLLRFNVPGLKPGATYTFRVAAANTAGAFAMSDAVSVALEAEMIQAGLPAGAKGVEYVDANGIEQYIDLLYWHNAKTSVESVFWANGPKVNAWHPLFGSRNHDLSRNCYAFYISCDNGYPCMSVNNETKGNANYELPYQAKVRLVTTLNAAMLYDMSGSQLWTSPLGGGAMNNGLGSMFVLGANNANDRTDGKNPYGYSDVRIYSFKIYEEGALVKNYVPIKDADGVACLCETGKGSLHYSNRPGDLGCGPETGEVGVVPLVASSVQFTGHRLNCTLVRGENVPCEVYAVWGKTFGDTQMLDWTTCKKVGEFPEGNTKAKFSAGRLADGTRYVRFFTSNGSWSSTFYVPEIPIKGGLAVIIR